MNKNIKSLIGLLIILSFATFIVIGTYYYVTSTGTNSPITDLIFKYHFEFMLLIGFGGIATGAISYYFFGNEVSFQKEVSKKNVGVLINLLDSSEKIIVTKLVAQNGKARQYEFTYDLKLTKVKTHRAVKKLVSKGVISVQRFGKVNIVMLNQEIFEALKD